MPSSKLFDKKTATKYALVNRPQDDPKIHDTGAPSQVFTEIGPTRHTKRSKVKDRGDLEDEFGLSVRANEGEAAEHGVFYDDSNYDYMQHMRDIGAGGGEATWLEAQPKHKGKGKEKQSLEDALREASLEDDTGSVSGFSMASGGSSVVQHRKAYEKQQEVPDELSGLQPDMDPRLREVLEALEDEEYVDEEDDMFAELAGKGNQEVSRDEWEASFYDENDDDEQGWESDETEKPPREYRSPPDEPCTSTALTEHDSLAALGIDSGLSDPSIPPPSAESQDLLASLAASKRGADNKPTLHQAATPKASDLASSARLSASSSVLPSRRKKRKGALSSSTGFSMTSSALARTEPLSLLDSRFDKIAEDYLEDSPADDEDGGDAMSTASGMTGASGMSKASGFSTASRGSAWAGSQAPSEAPSLISASQFDSVLDDFLGGAEGSAKARLMRKGGTQGRYLEGQGMKQLDEIRSGLGPARVSNRSTQKT